MIPGKFVSVRCLPQTWRLVSSAGMEKKYG
jgi:hypothetical protein